MDSPTGIMSVHMLSCIVFPIFHAPVWATTAGSFFSHGFLLFGFSAAVPCPSNTVVGISLIPGIGCPVVMSSTICAKVVGYGAGGSAGFAGAGSTPLDASCAGAAGAASDIP
jgi:hypothetical protein